MSNRNLSNEITTLKAALKSLLSTFQTSRAKRQVKSKIFKL
ncbi:hypothetical protein [Histophilus somni]|nr:hypothetical protein [Histophilus somni]